MAHLIIFDENNIAKYDFATAESTVMEDIHIFHKLPMREHTDGFKTKLHLKDDGTLEWLYEELPNPIKDDKIAELEKDLIESERVLPIFKKAVVSLDDETALEVVDYFPDWDCCANYTVGYRVKYNSTLYKCLQAHTAQPTWTPTDAPSLWARVLIPADDEIPEWVQPDSTNAYMTGDKVSYNGNVYVSTIDNNVWNPADYPQGWELVEEN